MFDLEKTAKELGLKIALELLRNQVHYEEDAGDQIFDAVLKYEDSLKNGLDFQTEVKPLIAQVKVEIQNISEWLEKNYK